MYWESAIPPPRDGAAVRNIEFLSVQYKTSETLAILQISRQEIEYDDDTGKNIDVQELSVRGLENMGFMLQYTAADLPTPEV